MHPAAIRAMIPRRTQIPERATPSRSRWRSRTSWSGTSVATANVSGFPRRFLVRMSAAPREARSTSSALARLRRRLCSLALGPIALWLDDVLRVARRLEAGLEHRPAQAELARADERSAGDGRRAAPPPARASSAAPRRRKPFRRPGELAGLALPVDLADLARAAAPSPASARPRRARRRLRAAAPGRLPRVDEDRGGGARARGGARAEDPRQLAARLVPDRHRGVREQRRRCTSRAAAR